jgi:hypothetical protein
MLKQILPQPVDNNYRGHKLALWFFALLLVMHLAMSLNCIFNGYFVAASADGVPLDAFPPAAIQAVLSLFATWGVEHFFILLLGILVLIRYRSLIPFMFAFLLLEDLARKMTLYLLPMARTGAGPGFLADFLFLAFVGVGLALSLRNARPKNPDPL